MSHQNYVTHGVREIEKPQHTTIGLPPGFDGCRLNVCDANGEIKSLRISRRVAEVLIAQGMPYEG